MFAYAKYSTFERANSALEHMLCTGEVSECELVGDWIHREGKYWVIYLRGC